MYSNGGGLFLDCMGGADRRSWLDHGRSILSEVDKGSKLDQVMIETTGPTWMTALLHLMCGDPVMVCHWYLSESVAKTVCVVGDVC